MAKQKWEELYKGPDNESRLTVFMGKKMESYIRLLAEVEDTPFPSAFFRKMVCNYVQTKVDEETHEAILKALEE